MNLNAKAMTDAPYTPGGVLADGEGVQTGKVTIVAGSPAYAAGTVLGKITASGKYKLSASASADGSQTPDVILIEDMPAATADIEAHVYRGGTINASHLTLGAGHTVDSIKEGLRVKGLFLM